jgi:hypothetical protein
VTWGTSSSEMLSREEIPLVSHVTPRELRINHDLNIWACAAALGSFSPQRQLSWSFYLSQITKSIFRGYTLTLAPVLSVNLQNEHSKNSDTDYL